MVSLSQRAAAVRMLAGHARNDGSLPSAAVHSVAAQFGISARQMRRHWAAHQADKTEAVNPAEDTALDEVTTLAGVTAAPPADRWWNDPTVLSALAGTNTLKDAWQRLQALDGLELPAYPAFTRTLKKHTDSAVYAAVTGRGGREGFLGRSLFLTYEAGHRNAVWQADAQEIPVDVTTDTGVRRVKPWQTTFIDDATRVVVATVITETQPRASDVVAAIAAGVRGQLLPNGTRIGGVPEAIRWDNGKEFLNEAVQAACARLGIQPQPCAPHSPWQKGKIERWHLTSQAELYDLLPGATHGPSTFTGTQPWRNLLGEVLTLKALTLRALAWIQTYNNERVHEALDTTPAAAWAADATPIQFADPAVFHQFSLAAARPRTVNRDGISVGGVKYLAAELGGIVRRKVEVRVLPHDPSVIAVFLDGKYLCEAYPAAGLDEEERRRILAHRGDAYRQAREHMLAGAQGRWEQARRNAEDAAAEADLAGRGPVHRDDADWDVAADDDALLAFDTATTAHASAGADADGGQQ